MNCINCQKRLSKPKYKRCHKCNNSLKKRALESRICLNCKKVFGQWPSVLKRGSGYGKYCSRSCRGKFEWEKNSNFRNINSNLTNNQGGENNPNWKGDRVGYGGLHKWITDNFGEVKVCEFCGKKKMRLEWANVTGNYNREMGNWKRLCKSCHNKQDIKLGPTAKFLFTNYHQRI